jgi:hypothetical protein
VNCQLVQGDIISFVVDLPEKQITCFKGETEVHKWTNVNSEEILPAICFGGSNQIVSIKAVELGSSVELTDKSLSVRGDRVFYHFPVNVGYLMRNENLWKTCDTE